jgi:outer membrane protein
MRCRTFMIFAIFFFIGACGIQVSAQVKPADQPAPLPQPSAPASQRLTLQDAERTAIQNHPQIQAATYLAAEAKAKVTEARSDYYPHAYGSATGVKAENNSRITAGSLTNSLILDRFSEGVTVDQLVTNFGRTHELVKSSNLHAKAEEENITTSRADILLRVDSAYYNSLKAKAVLQVAQETVKNRQLVSDQITELQKNSLRSGLDVSFANVDLAQAQLLLVQAQNDVQTSFAELSYALGFADQKNFDLAEEPLPSQPPDDLSALLQQAMHNRPEIISQQLDLNSAQSYATAERDLWLPTISAVATAGLAPYREDTLQPRYAAAGFNVNIPIFNGRQFNALHAEANAQASAQQQYLRDLQNSVVREVRKAWLNANSGYQRLAVTQQLLNQANLALNLAQERYKLGLSSIIELSQSQLNETQAQIAATSAKYDYEAELSALNYQVGSLQ